MIKMKWIIYIGLVLMMAGLAFAIQQGDKLQPYELANVNDTTIKNTLENTITYDGMEISKDSILVKYSGITLQPTLTWYTIEYKQYIAEMPFKYLIKCRQAGYSNSVCGNLLFNGLESFNVTINGQEETVVPTRLQINRQLTDEYNYIKLLRNYENGDYDNIIPIFKDVVLQPVSIQ